MMPCLRTPRLLLRPWRPSDIAAFNADIRVMEFFRSTLAAEQSRAFADRMQRFLVENGYGMFVVVKVAF